VTEFKGWLQQNSTLVYFLIAQFVFVGGLAFSGYGYMVRLEERVSTLETRGSPHLSTIDNRLTVLESQTRENKERLERVVEIMTRELNKQK
jgi:N6-adenosine-specific RNA methylase IME4